MNIPVQLAPHAFRIPLFYYGEVNIHCPRGNIRFTRQWMGPHDPNNMTLNYYRRDIVIVNTPRVETVILP